MLLPGCAPTVGPTGNLSQPVTTPEEAVEAARTFDPDDIDRSIRRLNAGVALGADLIAPLTPLLDDNDPTVRWAAIYMMSLVAVSPVDADLLMPALSDAEPTNRVVAAGALVGLGRVEAVNVLVDAIDSQDALPFDPLSRQIGDLAREALEYYTGNTFDDAAMWRNWRDTSAGRIVWDGARYVVR